MVVVVVVVVLPLGVVGKFVGWVLVVEVVVDTVVIGATPPVPVTGVPDAVILDENCVIDTVPL